MGYFGDGLRSVTRERSCLEYVLEAGCRHASEISLGPFPTGCPPRCDAGVA
jgi:hypothetical protein